MIAPPVMDQQTDPDPEQIPNHFGILDVAGECNRLHQENVEAARATIVRALRIGELLIAKKDELGHGNWLSWFMENIHFSIDTYENYKRVYERREELKLANVQTLDEAYNLIRYANRKKKASRAKTVAKAASVESDHQAELKRQATSALSALKVPNAEEWANKASGSTVEELIKNALRLREGTRDSAKNRPLLDNSFVQVTEAPFALPDENAPLRELDGLLGLAFELMKREGIGKMVKINDDDSEVIIIAKVNGL